MTNISQEPTYKLLQELEDIEKDIELYEEKKNLSIIKYNLIIQELIKRLPTLEGCEEFKQIGGLDENTRK